MRSALTGPPPASAAPARSLAGARLFMTADSVGGVWQYALDAARGLAAHGVTTTLAVLGPDPTRDQLADAALVPGLDLLLTGLPLDWLAPSPAEIARTERTLAGLAADQGADIVHLNSPALGRSGCFDAPVLAFAHSCVATWWRACRSGPLPPDFAWRAELIGAGLAAADALVAPTAAFADALVRTYDLSRTPIVVHNGRGAQRPRTRGGSGAAGPATAFTCGRLWDKGKNVSLLETIAADLPVTVEAAGPVQGPNGELIELRHVRSLGRLSDAAVAQRLASRPIFVSPTLYEPFGLAVLEAAQAGCPLVLSDIATFRELWDGAAIFADPRDPSAFASAIASLAADAARREALGAAARSHAGRYTPASFTAGLAAVYESLLVPAGSAAEVFRGVALA
jgi:glycosyltransferase involved in cell wall biosynthesis